MAVLRNAKYAIARIFGRACSRCFRALPIGCSAAYTCGMKRFAACLLVGLWTAFSCQVIPAWAAPRPGAPRPLQSGSTLEGNALISGTHARFENENLIFARGDAENNRAVLERWSATARYDEKATGKILDWKLQLREGGWDASGINWSNAISPDGSRLAYVSKHTNSEAIYVESTDQFADVEARRIAVSARNPVWQNNQTLIYQSTRPDRKGLYRVDVPADGSTPGESELLFSRGGEAAVSRDGKMICLAVVDEKSGASQLYLLAADGSGARTLAQTAGARRPVFSPDDKAIFFDAPAPIPEGALTPITPARERVLWTLPLAASPPVAQLFSTREAKNGDVEIIGTLFSEDSRHLQARLEFSPGEMDEAEAENKTENKDRAWFSCPLKDAPIQNGVLGAWPLPRKREGETQAWTMRLTATDDGGASAVSTLTFMWPPEKNADANILAPPLFGARPEDYGLTKDPEVVNLPKAVVPVKVPALPVPARVIAPAPKPVAPKAIAPKAVQPDFETGEEMEIEEFDPVEISPFPLPVAAIVASTPAPPLARRTENETVPPVAQLVAQKKPTPKPAPKPIPKKAAPKPAPKNDGGIPSQMKSGATVPVTVLLRNTGSRSWSSTGDSPVRLIYRWVNAENNIRQRWAVHWLGEVVEPGESTQMKFNLVAPPATGRFILTYALVRLNSQIYDGKSYKPPSTKAKDHRWPGEFGAVSFNITVTP